MTQQRISRTWRRSAALGGLLMIVGSVPLAAQCPADTTHPVKEAIIGKVTDAYNRALDSVGVSIAALRRGVLTDSNGMFRIPNLPVGEYELTVRRIGYEGVLQTIRVLETGGVGRFCLVPEVRGLAPMVTSVKRGGLSGVIGDSTYATVADAEVRVMGQGFHVLSDSSGGFYLPVKPGKYAVVVTKPGFSQQLISVTVPSDSGRQIAVWLTGAKQRGAAREANALEDLRVRVMMNTAARYRILTREDLSRTSMKEVEDVARTAGVVSNIGPDCFVTIEPVGYTIPVWMLKTNEVEMLEVSVPPMPRHTVAHMDPAQNLPTKTTTSGAPPPPGGTGVAGGAGTCGVQIIAWLRP